MTESVSDRAFSKRIKIDESEKNIQYESINNNLKHSIWNILFKYHLDTGKIPVSVIIQDDPILKSFCENVLYDFFKIPGDRVINGYLSNAIEEIRELYYKLKWNEVYDFLEFLANMTVVHRVKQSSEDLSFAELCNSLFERENSGYRFVNNKITKIS